MDVTCPKSQSWEVAESRLDSDPPNPSPVPFHDMSSQSLSFFLGKIIMSDNTPVPHWHWLYYVLFAHFTGYILTHDTSEVMGFCVMHLYLFVTSTTRLSHRMYAWFVRRNGCFGWDRWDRWASNMVIKFSHDTPPFSRWKPSLLLPSPPFFSTCWNVFQVPIKSHLLSSWAERELPKLWHQAALDLDATLTDANCMVWTSYLTSLRFNSASCKRVNNIDLIGFFCGGNNIIYVKFLAQHVPHDSCLTNVNSLFLGEPSPLSVRGFCLPFTSLLCIILQSTHDFRILLFSY